MTEDALGSDEKQSDVRKTRGIRFSGSEWDEIKTAAETHGIPVGEFVRERILAIARSGPNSDLPATPVGDLAPLIERTFRYSYILATKMRDDMILQGREEEMEKLIADARKVQASLRNDEAK